MSTKITALQKLVSYIFPVSILKTKSGYNTSLEVAVENGKLVLNSANANYSYGSLLEVFKKAFFVFNVDLKKTNSVLMLGMGAGSVVKFIAEQNPKSKIEAVEIDEVVIAIAEQVFEIDTFSSINIIHADAKKYLHSCDATFDLILVDLFIDEEAPSFCKDETFAKQLACISSTSTKIIFNTNLGLMENEKRVITFFNNYFQTVNIEKIKGNSILYAENKGIKI